MFRIAVVATAITIKPLSITQARGVTAPRMSSKPKTNSTVETKRALISGKGTCAETKAPGICSRRPATKGCPRQKKKKSSPTASRAKKNPKPLPGVQFNENCSHQEHVLER